MGSPGLPELLVLVVIVASLVVSSLYIITLKKTLERCSPVSRTINPNLVWLLLIPVFNIAWHFFVVINMSKSLRKEFAWRRFPDTAKVPGKVLGLVMCSLMAASAIPSPPEASMVIGFAGFVCWIIYWLNIRAHSKALERADLVGIVERKAPPPLPTPMPE